MAKFLIYMHSLKLSRCLKSWHVNLKNLNDSLLLFKISFRTSVMFRIKGKFIFFCNCDQQSADKCKNATSIPPNQAKVS